jgi:tetratricopeptide (TPR) repeat protein
MADELKARGNAHFKRGEYAQAADSYGKALAVADLSLPLAPTLLTNRAMCYFKLKRYEACVADCTEALKLEPGRGKALYRRALAYQAAGKIEDALEDARLFQQAEPSNADASTLMRVLTQQLPPNCGSSSSLATTLAFDSDNKDLSDTPPLPDELFLDLVGDCDGGVLSEQRGLENRNIGA